ncbi:J domain-containing protein [Geobacter pelophilus]|uniref:J domain-containing protein n=1 Tax=Geoanaerobacter pelophilus TaxID=60036 RepID=A0AAW4LEX7_9BACT|nr:J domain-containing protein [Geoanaerobacter pelophilus]MBT0666472.1 J domain-containing protein [Geoanaerobacter pelophilus]
MTYNDLQEALRCMGLGERATLNDIKARHKGLVKRYHLDTGNTDESEMIRQVNAAYQLLLEYVTAYRYTFTEDEFFEQNPGARIWKQFADDPLWGKR